MKPNCQNKFIRILFIGVLLVFLQCRKQETPSPVQKTQTDTLYRYNRILNIGDTIYVHYGECVLMQENGNEAFRLCLTSIDDKRCPLSRCDQCQGQSNPAKIHLRISPPGSSPIFIVPSIESCQISSCDSVSRVDTLGYRFCITYLYPWDIDYVNDSSDYNVGIFILKL